MNEPSIESLISQFVQGGWDELSTNPFKEKSRVSFSRRLPNMTGCLVLYCERSSRPTALEFSNGFLT